MKQAERLMMEAKIGIEVILGSIGWIVPITCESTGGNALFLNELSR